MHHFRLLYIISCVLMICLIPGLSAGQNINDFGFIHWSDLQLSVNEVSIGNPWTGGLNNVQVGEIDLNDDGENDLVVFEKHGSRLLPFIFHRRSGKSPQAWYVYDASYKKLFPPINSLFQLHDYNGDSKPDLFTYTTGGIMVYKNTSEETLRFEKVTNPFIRSLQGSIFTNLLITNVDYPGIMDLDNDGDLDIITFWGLGSFMELHQNMSVETTGNADSLLYHKVDNCWGQFAESVESNEIILDTCSNFSRQYIDSDNDEQEGLELSNDRHTGSTLCLLDINNDQLLDLLLGDVDYQNIQALVNDGTNISAHMSGHIDSFPAPLPVKILSFPCVQQVDLYNDGIDNLIVSPFDPGLVKSSGISSVWQYNVSDTSTYSLVTKSFLQEDMLDAGLGGYPVFAEITGDTLVDLLVSNYGIPDTSFYNVNGQLQVAYASSIRLYKNTGTSLNPSFTYITDDLGELKESKLLSIYPSVADINGDQLNDLLIGTADGSIRLYTNTGYVNSIARFAPPVEIQGNAGTFVTPAFADIDADGLMDFVAGNRTGKLTLFRNTGTLQLPAFSLATGDFGKVNVTDSTQSYTGYSVPAFFRDKQGSLRMMVGSESGRIHYYPQLLSDPQDALVSEDDVFIYMTDGIRSSVSLTDLNHDGFPDMAAGNYAGGVVMYKGIIPGPSFIAENPLSKENLKISPNPASTIIQIEMPCSALWHIMVYDCFGQLVQTFEAEGIRTERDINKLRSGLYLIVASQNMTAGNKYYGKMLITR